MAKYSWCGDRDATALCAGRKAELKDGGWSKAEIHHRAATENLPVLGVKHRLSISKSAKPAVRDPESTENE